MAQVKKAQSSLSKIQQKLKKGTDQAMIKALVSLASQEFANEDALQKVTDMLFDFQTKLEASLQKEHDDEAEMTRKFEEMVQTKENEIMMFTTEIATKTADLERVLNQILEAQDFIARRTLDKSEFESDIEKENQSYENLTNIYNDTIAQLNKELAACTEALSVLSSAEFAGYLSDRISSDRVIDTNHGSGIAVNDSIAPQ